MFNLKKSKKNIILLIILGLSITTILVSFAFFAVNVAAPALTDVNLGSDRSEALTFMQGDNINLNASMANFVDGSDTLRGSTTTTAKLIPSSSSSSATTNYNVYFYIDSNTFEYTQSSDVSEILLKVTGPEGEITNLTGFKYDTVTDVKNNVIKGFDITNYEGIINIAENYNITTTDIVNGKTDSWIIEVVFINLDADQSLNMGKQLNSKLILQKDSLSLNEMIINNDILNGSLIKHETLLSNSAADDNYRYSGSNIDVENYVCFGSDEIVCPEENIFRILGIYDNSVKLIKNKPIDKNNDDLLNVELNQNDTFTYSSSNNVSWENSDISNYLNSTYYDSFNAKYKTMIKSSYFNVGSINETNNMTAKAFNTEEIKIKTTNMQYIGLMQASDYMFGASQGFWSLFSYSGFENSANDYYKNEDMMNNNWIYLEDVGNYLEWTITSYNDSSNKVWRVHYMGHLGGTTANSNLAIRPVFYLNENILYSNGTGSLNNPYRLK